MLQRLIERLDFLSDEMNPLVLRDVRRMFRGADTIRLLCLYCVVLILIVIISWNDQRLLAILSLELACIICYIGILYGGFAAAGIMQGTFILDEVFILNGLSPRQYLHAYVTISTIKSLFLISLSLPPLTVVQLIGVRELPLAFVYIIPILTFLIGQTINLLVLSFVAYAKSSGIKCFPTIWERTQGIFALLLSSVGLGIPWVPPLGALYLWKEIFKLLPLSFYNRFDLISLYFFLPIMLLAVSAIAYGLCRNGFKINYKPKFSSMFYNVFIYGILSLCLTVIYFILVLCFR
jgi:hypothetical protein